MQLRVGVLMPVVLCPSTLPNNSNSLVLRSCGTLAGTGSLTPSCARNTLWRRCLQLPSQNKKSSQIALESSQPCQLLCIQDGAATALIISCACIMTPPEGDTSCCCLAALLPRCLAALLPFRPLQRRAGCCCRAQPLARLCHQS